MNNILTASRLGTFVRCMRQHFWAYEIGLRKVDDAALPLRFGTAWAKAMEARWKGATYEQALAISIPEGCNLEPYDCATLAGLLAAYYEVYGLAESFFAVEPEKQFHYQVEDGFETRGKIDGIGILRDGRLAEIENKTTGDSLDDSSDYWLRLRFNTQVLQYVEAAHKLGKEVWTVIYDVTRKPAIKPKQVVDLDADGKKIVLDQSGNRIFKKNGDPRESASEKDGWQVSSHLETPDEYCDRLYRDAMARPAFYFARREMPILEDQLDAFRKQRKAIGLLIKLTRENEIPDGWPSDENFDRNPDFWPRHVDKHVCGSCVYANMCLSGVPIDLNRLPPNFKVVQQFNPELDANSETTDENTSDATAS